MLDTQHPPIRADRKPHLLLTAHDMLEVGCGHSITYRDCLTRERQTRCDVMNEID